jgi:ribonuclease BN (tRNA processing enzyme)
MGIDDESVIERERSGLPTGQSIFIGALAGVTHGIVALALWEFFGFERPERTLSTEPLFVVYTLLGMFALGFVPGLLYETWRSVSPGLVIGGLLCLSSYGTWTTVRSGATPVDPTPFGWYALLWVGIAIPAAGAGGRTAVAHVSERISTYFPEDADRSAMRVTFLGTGSAMPTGERFQTGLLIEDPDGDAEPLLVDCGSGVVHGLASTNVGYEGISTVLLTHHHLDHVSDLMALLKARWLAGETELTIVGPDGTESLLDGLFDVHEYMQGRIDLTVREVGPGSTTVAGYDVRAVETVHSIYCLAYRFESEDAIFTFSGDTEAIDAVADLAEGSAVLAHDCSFPDEIDVENHPTPSTLGSVLAGHEIGRVYLTHLYPHTDEHHQEMIEAVEEQFNGDVRIARDGLTVDLRRTNG